MVAEILATLATFKALLSGPNLLSAGAYSPPTPSPPTLLILQSMVLGKITAQGWGLTGGVGAGGGEGRIKNFQGGMGVA